MNVEEFISKEINEDAETISKSAGTEFPITRAVFIDSTWHQTKSIYKDQRLRGLYLKVCTI